MWSKFWLGKKLSEEHKQKLRLSHIDKHVNEKHSQWKGDNVQYRALHTWINKNLPKPEACEFCHEVKKLEAANINRIYNRDFTNWAYLCHKCNCNQDKDKIIRLRDSTGKFTNKNSHPKAD